MKKFLLYAGMAFMLSFYTVAKIEAGSGGFNISIDSSDPCAGGAVDSTYVFTAKGGSNNPITMARREVKAVDDYSSTDWYYYNLPVYTKSEVQAGYYIDENSDLVLIMVYSADQEGKSGATVSRTSTDYGENWSASMDITDKQRTFGLAVAPSSYYVATTNHTNITLHKLVSDTNYSWSKENNTLDISHPDTQTSNNTRGLSVIFEDPLVSVAFVNCKKRLKVKNYSTSGSTWTNGLEGRDYNNDTAWLCNDIGATKQFLAAKKKNVGVRTTSNLTDYSDFSNWTDQGKFPVSGMWRCPLTVRVYELSTDDQKLYGIANPDYEQKKVLYESNQNSSFQRRVSMFNVPAKQ